MGSLRLLHVADTHLGHRQYGLIEREADVYQVFHEVVDVALEERVDLVVHGGDFFDSTRPPAQSLIHAVRGLRRLRDAGIPVVVVPGDHDLPRHRAAPPLMLLQELGLVTLLSTFTSTEVRLRTRNGEVYVVGIENHRGAQVQSLKSVISRVREPPLHPSVFVVHQALREVSPSYELQVDELPRGYSYYALGHLHLTKILWRGESALAYPGSPEALRMDEARCQPDRYILLVELRGRTTLLVDRVRLRRVRPQLYVEVEPGKLEEALRQLALKALDYASAGKHPIIHLVVRGNIEDKHKLMSMLERLLGKHTLLYRVISVASGSRGASEELREIPTRVDVREVLSRIMGDSKLAETALQLINALSHDPKPLALTEAMKVLEAVYKGEVSKEGGS